MTSWIAGDIHGCARELETLVEKLDLGADDELVCVGDLLHRGPDPVGVMEILREIGARFVLGNHERKVLKRCGLAPRCHDGSDRPPRRSDFHALEADDLRGDGKAPCHADDDRCGELLEFLQDHSGYTLTNVDPGSAELEVGDWRVVHAGLLPGIPIEEMPIDELTYLRKLPGRRAPWWYESWTGPELVLFGHTPSRFPRAWRVNGRLVAMGLDTGCVYGGSLSAYAPELDELLSVPAEREWVSR
jgi:hypothetical protein